MKLLYLEFNWLNKVNVGSYICKAIATGCQHTQYQLVVCTNKNNTCAVPRGHSVLYHIHQKKMNESNAIRSSSQINTHWSSSNAAHSTRGRKIMLLISPEKGKESLLQC